MSPKTTNLASEIASILNDQPIGTFHPSFISIHIAFFLDVDPENAEFDMDAHQSDGDDARSHYVSVGYKKKY